MRLLSKSPRLVFAGFALLGLTGCESSDLAAFAAVASGTAGEYARQGGNAAQAAEMFGVRDKILADLAADHQRQEAEKQARADQAARDEAMRAHVRQRREVERERTARDADLFIPATPPPRGVASLASEHASSGRGAGADGDGSHPGGSSDGSASSAEAADGLTGVWRNEKATWYFSEDGTARIVIPTLNGQGVATTYINWRFDADAGLLHYTITRATLEGSDGYDYDRAVDQSFTQGCRLEGGELIINTERLHR